MTDLRHHVIVIGGGVVVLGVALEITRRIPSQRLLVLEKEDRVARHQSGFASNVRENSYECPRFLLRSYASRATLQTRPTI